jgi:hypothetical protein
MRKFLIRILGTALLSSFVFKFLDKSINTFKQESSKRIGNFIKKFFIFLLSFMIFLIGGIMFALVTLALFLNNIFNSNYLGFGIISILCFLIFFLIILKKR